ncbi:hypothetical protein [Anaerolentibacter hominis]|uniref:hypothetical protein n=1 Tax=Anaerolentibacter hominis TaxID=3079009 RepID=UPI0031B8530B
MGFSWDDLKLNRVKEEIDKIDFGRIKEDFTEKAEIIADAVVEKADEIKNNPELKKRLEEIKQDLKDFKERNEDVPEKLIQEAKELLRKMGVNI